jgi:serine/threonine protein phosphatase PrpC
MAAVVGTASDQRYREAMEDRTITGTTSGSLVVGVFDGHGGSIVSDHAAAHALDLIGMGILRGHRGATLWRSVFTQLDVDSRRCGSTATLLLVTDAELAAAWVGDSRAIVVSADGWRPLTEDHRLENTEERRRVVAAGASIVPPYAVDPKTEYGLMVTRALGDRDLRRIGIVAEPDTRTVAIAAGDVGFIAATDGLWDVVTNAEAAAVCRAEAPDAAAKRLVDMVTMRDGRDNVSVVVGRF